MSYYGFTVTDKGRALIAKLVAGKKLELSKIMVGSGSCPNDTKPRELLDLCMPVAEATSTTPVYDGEKVSMTVEYRSDMNGGLKKGFWLKEFGIYAVDPDEGEILIYYGSLGDYPQWVSPLSKTGIDVRRFPVCIIIGDDLGVSVDYKCQSWMTAEDVNKYCMETLLPQMLETVKQYISESEANRDGHRKYDITLISSEWQEAEEDKEYKYFYDFEIEGCTEADIPNSTVLVSSLETAKKAGMFEVCKTLENCLRFYSKGLPETDINISVVLLSIGSSSGGSGGSSGNYVLPVASQDRLGGIRIGNGLNIDKDGTASINTEDISAQDGDVEEMIDNVFDEK
mgnify:CR=1 FL=1